MRSNYNRLLDTATFPVRAFLAFGRTEFRLFGLSSFSDERYDYVAKEVVGYCLDIGCGNNRFIKENLKDNGIGIDFYKHEGLSDNEVVTDPTHLPFESLSFDSVTFIANINHVPKQVRDQELGEAYRCLKSGGNIIITNGNPIAEIIVHNMGFLYEDLCRLLKGKENNCGYSEKDDELFLSDNEIIQRLEKIGFVNISKKYFLTQWGLNHLILAWK